MNSTKRYLNEKVKELQEFTKRSSKKKTFRNLTDTNTNKEIMMNQLRDYRKKVQGFETALPENE